MQSAKPYSPLSPSYSVTSPKYSPSYSPKSSHYTPSSNTPGSGQPVAQYTPTMSPAYKPGVYNPISPAYDKKLGDISKIDEGEESQEEDDEDEKKEKK